MTDEQRLVWERVSAFPLDTEGAAFPYSVKLQKENGWSLIFTLRVIEEYRRFAFLSVVANHQVSPSDAVDQAWHFHLFYTQSYWNDFCKKALGRPLHHYPSLGGRLESSKYDDAYRLTLETYARFFGEAPPADIWPTPKTKQAERHNYARVDRNSNWVIPKVRIRPWLPYIGSACLAFLLIGCTAQATTFDPFQLDGPSFLVLYGCILAGCAAVALVIRSFARLPGGTDPSGNPTLTPLETAELAVGEYGSIKATIAGLIVCGYLKVHPVEQSVEAVNTDTTGLDPLAAHIVTDCALVGGQTVAHLTKSTALSLQAVRDRLVQRQLLLGHGDRLRLGMLCGFIAVLPLGIAIPRLIGGIGLGHPVEYLVLFILATVVIAAGFAFVPPRRTLRGDGVLRHQREELASLCNRVTYGQINVPDTTMAIALFGMTIMPVAMQADMRALLVTQSSGSTFWSNSNCGGNCGNSGCGGGSCGGGCGG